jgi:signal peptidase I
MRPEDDRRGSQSEFTPAVFIPAELPEHSGLRESPALPSPVNAPLPRPSALERLRDELFVWFKTLVSAAVYATIIVTFGFQVARVDGESMIPTLENRDRLIVNKLVYSWTDPKVGDVVMHYWPEDPSKSFVKRVVAAEGDTIRSDAGKIYRNEVLMDDSFIPAQYRMQDTWGPVTVRRGYYFVLGDHRNNSSDSRIWGEVPKKYIIGKIQVRWWPVNHARIFETP